MGKLDGKVIIVTGASRGIGAEIARVFAVEGGKVICSARTVQEGTHPLEGSLEKTIADIQAAGGEATAVAANVSLPEECVQLVQETREKLQGHDSKLNKSAIASAVAAEIDHGL